MNWELKGAYKTDIEAFLKGDHQAILLEGIEEFAPQLGSEMDFITFDGENRGPNPHGPAGYSEWPDGPYIRHPKDGVAYRVSFTAGFYRNGKFVILEPSKYNMQVSNLGPRPDRPPFSGRRIKEVKGIS